MKEKVRKYLPMHFVFLLYSVSGILSKSAAQEPFLSKKFIIIYAGLIFLLAGYALAWQQIIKRVPITVAYANKAILSIWTILWGKLFFNEQITPGKLIGVAISMAGVILLTTEKEVSDE